MGVPDENEVGSGCEEISAEVVSRPEGVVVPVREKALARVRGQICVQPLLLSAAGAAADIAAVRVERDQVPRAEAERVVPLARFAGCRSEVVVVAARPRRLVLVVSRHWRGDRLHLSPRQVVGVRELLESAPLVLLVAEGKHAVGGDVEKELSGCGLLAGARGGLGVRLARDVSGGSDDGVGCGRGSGRAEAQKEHRRHGQPSIRHRESPLSLHPVGASTNCFASARGGQAHAPV